MNIRQTYILASLLIVSSVYSQVIYPPDSMASSVKKEKTINKQIIPYTYLREADVQWQKTIWRVIDLREKINLPLYYPITDMGSRVSLFQVLKKGILNNEIMAFNDDEFLSPMSLFDVRKKFMRCDSLDYQYVDEITGEPKSKRILACDSVGIYNDVKSYEIKEEWFFDKQKSVMEVRILGIAPRRYDEEKDINITLFWVYFPACRPLLATHETFNPQNEAEQMSYDDLFIKRMFSSFISKESNVYDRRIAEYAHGIDALLESDRIKNEIFEYEHNLWHY